MREERTKERIQENIKLLQSALEGYKEEYEYTYKLRDKYFLKYDDDRESQVIADALCCYMSELKDQMNQTSSVLDREKEKNRKIIILLKD